MARRAMQNRQSENCEKVLVRTLPVLTRILWTAQLTASQQTKAHPQLDHWNIMHDAQVARMKTIAVLVPEPRLGFASMYPPPPVQRPEREKCLKPAGKIVRKAACNTAKIWKGIIDSANVEWNHKRSSADINVSTVGS